MARAEGADRQPEFVAFDAAWRRISTYDVTMETALHARAERLAGLLREAVVFAAAAPYQCRPSGRGRGAGLMGSPFDAHIEAGYP